ncbi:PREDICTED: nudix hydrolase 14, chloroplastic [Erythranthe guttata]|uniref:nudix hydrolase 14, chloroplastic n=1 Tax=Erythranthe guttata TaxID=4155 RepID=UPI00064D7922|nr:PREDICTED: nudix hydrolase 14, chloroplastic [Erythranthe guttata]|eukprot:XP_012835522.1 PREDICTED: nudix hydrolase 14, chloroplastic [Erythranthe guttata]
MRAFFLPISRHIVRIENPNPLTNPTHFSSTATRRLHKANRIFSEKMATESTSSQLTHTINLPGQLGQPLTVVAAAGVSDSDFRNAIECTLFKQWLKNIQTETGLLSNGAMSVKRVVIQGVDMFGNRVGFLKFKADVIDKETGSKVPGIVFARGPAVAVLILLDSDGETYAVLTEQVRVPVGKLVLELPAGMLDDDKGDIVGTAVREVEEETGLHLNLDDVVDLTAFLHPSTGCRVFPSPGGCDEEIGLFLYRGSVDREIIKQLQGKETGLREHGELIRVHVVPYKNLWRMTADAKVLMAIAIYEMAKRDGFLPST